MVNVKAIESQDETMTALACKLKGQSRKMEKTVCRSVEMIMEQMHAHGMRMDGT